jgi:hypothetical protein
MNIQEREELDYNPDTELRNAYAQSQMEIERHDPRIAEAVGRGKHVVVANVPAFCPRTDAAMGEKTHYESEHDDRDTAEQAKAALEAEAAEHDYDEIYWTIASPPGTILTHVDEVTGDVTEQDAATGEVMPPPDDVPF